MFIVLYKRNFLKLRLIKVFFNLFIVELINLVKLFIEFDYLKKRLILMRLWNNILKF